MKWNASGWVGDWSSALTWQSSSSVYLHAAQVIALGEPVKQIVVTEKGVPADRVSVIYPGIDLAEYEASWQTGVDPRVLPENKVIMYVGSIIHPNQGVPSY